MRNVGRIAIHEAEDAVVVHIPRDGAPAQAGPEIMLVAIWLPVAIALWWLLGRWGVWVLVGRLLVVALTVGVVGALVTRFTMREQVTFTADQIRIVKTSPLSNSEEKIPAANRSNLRAVTLLGMLSVAVRSEPAPAETFRRGAVILDGPRTMTGIGYGLTSAEAHAIVQTVLARFPHYGRRDGE